MDSIEELKVTVSSETARTIREKVEDGSYASPGEVMTAALEALKREDHAARLASIKARIKASIEDKRPGYPAEEVFADLKARLKKLAEEEGDTRGPGHTGAEVRAYLQEQARILSGGDRRR
jgi:antitoxin ParD1/3/4